MEDMFMSLSRFIKEKMVPAIKKGLTPGEIIRITGNPKDLERMDDLLVRHAIYKSLEENPVEKLTITEEVLEEAVRITKEELKNLGEDRFPQIAKEIFDFDYDLKIVITDEQINKAVLAQLLQQTLGILVQAGLPIQDTMRELFDTLGLDGDRLVQQQEQPQEQGAEQIPTGTPPAGISQTPNPATNVPV
jgi:ASC-1-like (ASCH) protein